MRNFFLSALCATALIGYCKAQGDYQAGYVVNPKGDTVQGVIEFKRWDRNPQKINFKSSAGSTPVEYHPFKIRSFAVAGEIYESGIVDVDLSPYKLRDLDQSPLPSYVKDTVFLQSLISGAKSLLFLKDQNGKSHFYIKEHESYHPLIYKQYAGRTETSSKVVAENTTYKGSLALYLKECPEIQQKLKNTGYSQSDLTKVFKYFYQCTQSSVHYTKERQEGKIEAGILVGVAITKLDFSGPIKYLTDIEYGPSTNPTFGFFLDFKLLRTKGMRISNDLLYTSFETEGQGAFEDFPDYTAYSDFSYGHIKSLHELQISLLGQGKFYFAAGFSTGIAVKNNSSIAISYETGTTSILEFESRNFEFGYLGGLGFRTGNWNAEVRYERTTGISNYLNEGSTLSRGSFFIRYRVFKE